MSNISSKMRLWEGVVDTYLRAQWVLKRLTERSGICWTNPFLNMFMLTGKMRHPHPQKTTELFTVLLIWLRLLISIKVLRKKQKNFIEQNWGTNLIFDVGDQTLSADTGNVFSRGDTKSWSCTIYTTLEKKTDDANPNFSLFQTEEVIMIISRKVLTVFEKVENYRRSTFQNF